MIPPTSKKRIASKARLVTGAILWSVVLTGCGGQIDTASGTTSSTTGGATATGGTSATGGAYTGGNSPAGGASSTIDIRACLTDSDCTQCLYITAPSNPNQCDDALGCCGGQVMNTTTCATNQAAWEANCSGYGYTIQGCPCISCGTCTLGCKNGECGFY